MTNNKTTANSRSAKARYVMAETFRHRINFNRILTDVL